MTMTHYDCKYFLPTDSFKGLCKKSKTLIKADGKVCSNYEKIPKCKHCTHFTRHEIDLGRCMQSAITFADLKAVTCDDFSWR